MLSRRLGTMGTMRKNSARASPGSGGGTSVMNPYYIIMRLPGEARAAFFLLVPLAPRRRANMI
ncbi:hypothetical protein FNJ47_31390, partial [Bradyrhizobium sp. UFLA 03-164]|nr:hypothetical protein [Bradyrhizobium uaiense]